MSDQPVAVKGDTAYLDCDGDAVQGTDGLSSGFEILVEQPGVRQSLFEIDLCQSSLYQPPTQLCEERQGDSRVDELLRDRCAVGKSLEHLHGGVHSVGDRTRQIDNCHFGDLELSIGEPALFGA